MCFKKIGQALKSGSAHCNKQILNRKLDSKSIYSVKNTEHLPRIQIFVDKFNNNNNNRDILTKFEIE